MVFAMIFHGERPASGSCLSDFEAPDGLGLDGDLGAHHRGLQGVGGIPGSGIRGSGRMALGIVGEKNPIKSWRIISLSGGERNRKRHAAQ
jgi:hypothetical protein